MSRRTKKPHITIDTADDRVLTTRELLERIPLNRSTIWRMVQEGRFVAPIRLGRARIGWRWSSVLAWLSERENDPLERRDYFKKRDRDAEVA